MKDYVIGIWIKNIGGFIQGDGKSYETYDEVCEICKEIEKNEWVEFAMPVKVDNKKYGRRTLYEITI